MRLNLSLTELNERILLNYRRLADDPYYQIDDVFSPPSYSWMGDKEGRALLAFVSHYKISGQMIPCMEQLLEKLPSMVNEKNYLGACGDNLIREEQLSGHSWLLRGLCEHFQQFGDGYSLELIRDITEQENLRMQGAEMKQQTVEIADKVIEKQMRIVQEIASLLGETTAETQIALTRLKDAMAHE